MGHIRECCKQFCFRWLGIQIWPPSFHNITWFGFTCWTEGRGHQICIDTALPVIMKDDHFWALWLSSAWWFEIYPWVVFPVDWHLGSFQFGTFMHKTAMSICLQVLMWKYVLLLLVNFLRNGITWHITCH